MKPLLATAHVRTGGMEVQSNLGPRVVDRQHLDRALQVPRPEPRRVSRYQVDAHDLLETGWYPASRGRGRSRDTEANVLPDRYGAMSQAAWT